MAALVVVVVVVVVVVAVTSLCMRPGTGQRGCQCCVGYATAEDTSHAITHSSNSSYNDGSSISST